MATWVDLSQYKHCVVRSDGAKFLDGERNDSLNTSWLTVNSSGRVTLGPGFYDELLVVKGEVSDDQIKAWANMGAPFYDPAGNIVYEGAGGRIEMDKDGQRFIRSADGQTMIEMDTETGDARFAGDITGASGEFADGKVAIGNLSGRPWGSGTLPAGTAGIWGEQAGIYLRGYSSLLASQALPDGGIITVPEDRILNNPEILIIPQDVLIYHPNMTERVNLVTGVETVSDRAWKVSAKLVLRGLGDYQSWGSKPKEVDYWEEVRGTPHGIEMDYLKCRLIWDTRSSMVHSGTAEFWLYITDTFNSSGSPINWRLVNHFKRTGLGDGTLNWDLPLERKRWAIRLCGEGDYAWAQWAGRTGITDWGYSLGNRYLNNEGKQVASANVPSGVQVVVQVFDQG